MRLLSFTVAAILAAPPLCRAQAPLATGTGAPAARLDVLVSDARGVPLDNLGPADFEVVVNGAALPVAEARFLRAAGPTAESEAPQPIASRADEQAQAAREGTRLFGVLLDEYHVSPGAAAERGRAALMRFVETQLGPLDLIVLVKPLDSLVNLRMTRDRQVIHDAIQRFEGRKGVYEPRNAFERSFFAGSPERIEATRAQVAVSALNALAIHMGGLSAGRKSIILVSEELARPERRRGEGPLPTVDTVIRSANRANVSLYPFDPSGAAGSGARAALELIARETDGIASFTPADFDGAFERVARDASAFYLLTIPGLNDGRFHAVDVRVKRADAVVRSRKGLWAPSAEEAARRAALRAAAAAPPLLPRRASPLIRPWFGQARAAGGNTAVSFVWEPVVRPVVQGARPSPTPARITFRALRGDGSVLFEGVSRPAAASVGSTDEPSRLVFTAPPGRVRVEMSIEDVQLRQVDTDVRDLVVSDFSGKVALGTLEVLRARTARDFRALESNPQAAPTAAREFSRAERLLIRVPAYAPDGGAAQVSARLSSRLGSAMRDLAAGPGPVEGVYQIDLPLAGLAIGEYSVEITAAANGETARDTFVFRIVP